MPAGSIRTTLLCLLLAALVGCGFTLRGAGGPMALNSVSLEAGRPDGVVRTLRQQLTALGVNTQPDRDDSYTLTLDNEQREARRTTQNTGTRGAQYELTLSVDVTLSLGDNVVAGPRNLEVQRDQDEDISNLTSSGGERALLYADMERELADQIVQQLRTVQPAAGGMPQ
ncbi:MAG: LPS assembly lipoprotein LptE [Pseudohongiellaceae bacterium]